MGELIENSGKPIEKSGRLIENSGRLIEKSGNLLKIVYTFPKIEKNPFFNKKKKLELRKALKFQYFSQF